MELSFEFSGDHANTDDYLILRRACEDTNGVDFTQIIKLSSATFYAKDLLYILSIAKW